LRQQANKRRHKASRVVQKLTHFCASDNFIKHWPNFKLFSLSESEEKL